MVSPNSPNEQLLTIKEAAETLGLPYWKLNRAVRQNLIPSYTLLNSRRYVRVSEVVAQLNTHKAEYKPPGNILAGN